MDWPSLIACAVAGAVGVITFMLMLCWRDVWGWVVDLWPANRRKKEGPTMSVEVRKCVACGSVFALQPSDRLIGCVLWSPCCGEKVEPPTPAERAELVRVLCKSTEVRMRPCEICGEMMDVSKNTRAKSVHKKCSATRRQRRWREKATLKGKSHNADA